MKKILLMIVAAKNDSKVMKEFSSRVCHEQLFRKTSGRLGQIR